MKKLLMLAAMSSLMATSMNAQSPRKSSKMLHCDGPVLTNIRLDQRDFLMQQKSVTDRKARCAIFR